MTPETRLVRVWKRVENIVFLIAFVAGFGSSMFFMITRRLYRGIPTRSQGVFILSMSISSPFTKRAISMTG